MAVNTTDNHSTSSSTSGEVQSDKADRIDEVEKEWDSQRRNIFKAVKYDDDDNDEDAGELDQSALPPLKLHRTHTHTLGRLKFRAQDDSDPIDWWFASTAIPLIVATLAPMANVLSIAALVVYWRNNVTNDDPTQKYETSVGFPDPKWCYDLNAVSLACGLLGNLFLLFNFTQRVRYIIALPMSIIFFYAACGILIGIIGAMNQYTPPGPNQVYSQGFWHAVLAAILYIINSMLLMVNMLGYFLGHYPQHFTLNDEQRNLILQTMLFFLWLAGGAAVFAKVQDWNYPDALYFCDVTLLTIGFGDFVATNDVSRGLVFPFSVGGTIILGLMVSSLHKFAGELSKEKILKKHVETRRVNTLSRIVTMEKLDDKNLGLLADGKALNISRPLQRDADGIQADLDALAKEEREKRRVINFEEPERDDHHDVGESPSLGSPLSHQFLVRGAGRHSRSTHSTFSRSLRSMTLPLTKPVSSTANSIRRVMTKGQKHILMLEERDRFNAMRDIQENATQFKKYYALGISIVCFGMLWCLGAMVFYFVEAETQQLSYFESLYFGYVSLLTIGYGDLSPRSNAGKPFFVFWSLIAVPTMTILISDLGDTVIGGFKRGVLQNDLGLTSAGDPTGSVGKYLRRLGRFTDKLQGMERQPSESASSTIEKGDPSPVNVVPPRRVSKTLDQLADDTFSDVDMLRRLAFAIRHAADDLSHYPGKRYSYEEWVEFTRVIKWSKLNPDNCKSISNELDYDEAVDGVVEWDWLDEKSPMNSEQTESEWVLDRLCESLLRTFKRSDLQLAGAKVMPQTAADVEELNAAIDPSSAPQWVVPALQLESPSRDDPPRTPVSPMHPRRTSMAVLGQLPGMQGVRQLLNGDVSSPSNPVWSKRGRAKNETETSDVGVRRKSSGSIKRKRHGPFAYYRPSPAGAPRSENKSFTSRKLFRSS